MHSTTFTDSHVEVKMKVSEKAVLIHHLDFCLGLLQQKRPHDFFKLLLFFIEEPASPWGMEALIQAALHQLLSLLD